MLQMLLIYFKKIIQKLPKAPGYLVGNKVAYKITSNPKTSPQTEEKLMDILKKRYVSPENGQQLVDELRLI